MHILESAGRALYGRHGEAWREIRQDIGLNDRTFRRILAGSRPMPDGIARELEIMLRDRVHAIDDVLGVLGEIDAPHYGR